MIRGIRFLPEGDEVKNGNLSYIPGILRRVALCGVIAILLAACSPGRFVSGVNPFDNSDEESLTALYNATGGADWKNSSGWLSDEHIASWHGVRYMREERTTSNPMGGTSTHVVQGVIGLDLRSNGLKGEIPSELGNFESMSRVWLGGNQLSGEIPSELGKLDNLTHLQLSANQLSGEIPSQLGKLRFLSYLYLGRNQLSGEIPSEMGSVRDLTGLDLSNNRLSGEIPTELGSLRRLSFLYLNDNQLTGEIPSGLGRLQALYVGGNQFTGCIPSRLRSVQENDFLRLGLDFCGDGKSLIPPGSDTEALVALYNATDGENWPDNTNWMSSESVCKWYGVSCRGSRTGRVLTLNLAGHNLSGELPAELGNLTGLLILNLGQNNLSGDIPPELGSLKRLHALNLAQNNFSGDIPSELGTIAGLSQLNLNDNRLSGEIPPELGSIERLRILNLSGNDLEGSLPSEFGNLNRLETLVLNGNRFTGCVPLTIARDQSFNISDVSLPLCESLERPTLVALYNAMGGKGWNNNTNWLSEEPVHKWYGVGTDGAGRISYLDLSGNQLSGKIPAELGDLANLKILHLNDNQLSGDIPYELGNLAKLIKGELSDNQLTGCIPRSLRGAIRNRSLGLPFCDDNGAVPGRAALVAFYKATNGDNWTDNTNWLSELPLHRWKGVVTNDSFRVTRIILEKNHLSGELPPELSDLTELESLRLKRNRLTGTIPSVLGGMDSLRRVDLTDNQLTGEIPAELGNAVSLSRLLLDNNQLTGEIPAELGNAVKLNWLQLGNNQLTGEIPPELGRVSSLLRLHLYSNRLTGEIPPELGDLIIRNRLSVGYP